MDEILILGKEFKSKIDSADSTIKIEQIKSEAFGKKVKLVSFLKKFQRCKEMKEKTLHFRLIT